jgi:hypothetical protein
LSLFGFRLLQPAKIIKSFQLPAFDGHFAKWQPFNKSWYKKDRLHEGIPQGAWLHFADFLLKEPSLLFRRAF